jgi:hypothetical protein
MLFRGGTEEIEKYKEPIWNAIAGRLLRGVSFTPLEIAKELRVPESDFKEVVRLIGALAHVMERHGYCGSASEGRN